MLHSQKYYKRNPCHTDHFHPITCSQRVRHLSIANIKREPWIKAETRMGVPPPLPFSRQPFLQSPASHGWGSFLNGIDSGSSVEQDRQSGALGVLLACGRHNFWPLAIVYQDRYSKYLEERYTPARLPIFTRGRAGNERRIWLKSFLELAHLNARSQPSCLAGRGCSDTVFVKLQQTVLSTFTVTFFI